LVVALQKPFARPPVHGWQTHCQKQKKLEYSYYTRFLTRSGCSMSYTVSLSAIDYRYRIEI
jgi:hypothetical protein